MRCRYCGTDRNLVQEPWEDEDGFVTHDPIDLCESCVEHDHDRSRARREWSHFHDEPCPEIELPQPAPIKST